MYFLNKLIKTPIHEEWESFLLLISESMKTLSLILVTCTLIHSSIGFAACEEERRRADRAAEITNDWSRASGLTAMAGMLIGGKLFGPLGGLCGGIGLIPGLGACRANHLKEKREKILRECLARHVAAEEQKKEQERQQQIDLCAEQAGQCLGRLFMIKKAEYQELALRQFDEYLEALIDTDHTPEEMFELLEAERQRINSQYF